jgi:hypothetical protein
MAYKIIISKKGEKIGETIIESLDTNSCGIVQEVSLHTGPLKSSTSINHDDDIPVNETIFIE